MKFCIGAPVVLVCHCGMVSRHRGKDSKHDFLNGNASSRTSDGFGRSLSLSILRHLYATPFPLLFFTPPISPSLCCRPWTEDPVERDLTPGRRTSGGAPPWGEERRRSLMLRTCSLRVHAELTGGWGGAPSGPSSAPHPRRDIAVAPPLSSPQAL
jgi:hypothetical protein